MFRHNAKKPITRVLVVEDEGDMCLLLELLLDGKGMAVDHVRSLTDAREFLEREQPTLIVLDNRLPDGLGIDFIAYLKARFPAIKILMISGVDIAAKDAALETGADTFLPKPFTQSQLQNSVSELLN
ncbi:MAG TPA: response regulator [Puia sp.]|jgi:two-component system OmpR family response regulator|nr:response regulator [Puia sp.]